MKNFTVPPNGEIYIHTVQDRCMDLISYGIWTGLSQVDVRKWLKNFDGIEEKYFAACVLDYLIYRSEGQTEALANHLFTKILVNKLEFYGLKLEHHRSLIDMLRGNDNPKIRLVTVGGKADRPSKSSDIILRMLRRGDLNLNENLFIKPSEVEQELRNGIKYLIFIDDFLGTGNQFYGMVKEYGLLLSFSKACVIYAPLVAHEQGIAYLNNCCPEISIVCGEKLKSDSNVFNLAFVDKDNSPEIARRFYDQILDKHGFKYLDQNKYGYGNLGLAYGFQHAIPDSSLNILWDDYNNWVPLMKK